jgi:hypothetical protein
VEAVVEAARRISETARFHHVRPDHRGRSHPLPVRSLRSPVDTARDPNRRRTVATVVEVASRIYEATRCRRARPDRRHAVATMVEAARHAHGCRCTAWWGA